jgi:hypothetical protein
MILLPIISLGFLILFLMGALISFQFFTHYQSLNLLERTYIEDQRQRAQKALGFVVVFSFGAVIALGGLLIPAIAGLTPTPVPPSATLSLPGALPTTAIGEETQSLPSDNGTATIPAVVPEKTTPTAILPTGIIGNTGGAGANIRSAPGLTGTIIETLSEGTRVFLLDEIQQVDGFNWQFIEMPDTRDGWVAVQFLISDN